MNLIFLRLIFWCDSVWSLTFTNAGFGCSGYMSPEYAMNGHFSVKSDVFSFGVIVLEIISGRKNWGFYDPDHDYNLIGHVSA